MKTFSFLNTILLAGILCVLILTSRRLDTPLKITNRRNALDVTGTVAIQPGSDPIKIDSDEPIQVTIVPGY